MSRTIDKSKWGDGPWQTEDDEASWSFGDVACRIVRSPHEGHLNGYVCIPPSHPWYGQAQESVSADIDAYDGVTFAGRFNRNTFASATDDGWWIGFHCGGTWDYRPAGDYIGLDMEPTPNDYRTIGFVREQTERLARQAIAATRVAVGAGEYGTGTE